MKRILISAILALLMLGSSVVLASDTSNAVYKTTIQITNTGTAVTNQVATVNISTADEITAGRLDADALECALLTGTGGSDIAFMPSVNSSYPWCTFVSSVGGSSTLNQYLYALDVTEGKIAIFTDDDGMTIDDDASMEGGDNCTTTFTNTFIDIDTEAPLFKKNTVYLGPDNSGNLVFGLEVNEAKNFNMEIDTGWTGAVGAQSATTPYEGQYCWTVTSSLNGKYASQSLDWDDSYKGQSFTVGGWVKISSGTNSNARIDIYDGIGTTSSNATVSASYQYLSVTRVLNAAATQLTIRLFLTNTHGSSRTAYFDSLTITPDNWTDIDYGTPILSATATTGEHDVILDLNTVNATLTVDGAVVDTAALGGASIPDNPVDWQIGSASTPYIGGFNFAVDGDDVCTIEWEYDTTFTDLSGNGNDATPSFRTTASDADLSGEVIAQSGLATASTPTAGDTESGWNMVTTTLAAPDNLFTQSASPTYGIGDFNFGDLISGAASDAGQDATNWHYMAAFTLAISAGVFVFAKTHSSRMGRKGSLLLSAVTTEIVLVCFYLFEAISGLALIPFALIALLLVMWRKSPAPVD